MEQIELIDGALAATTEVMAKLEAVLAELQPDLVYVPFFLDPHPDHRAVDDILVSVAEAGRYRFRCCAYETWSPLIPNVLVDVSAQMQDKLAAIRCHASQVRCIDYARLIEGLNIYRTIQCAERVQYAEAFYLTELPNYVKLCRAGQGSMIASTFSQ